MEHLEIGIRSHSLKTVASRGQDLAPHLRLELLHFLLHLGCLCLAGIPLLEHAGLFSLILGQLLLHVAHLDVEQPNLQATRR
jgi:hypothetical protein